MNRKAIIKINNLRAGLLEEVNRSKFTFSYYPEYLLIKDAPAVSLTLPKKEKVYESETLFPFFTALLAEGANLSLQSRILKIDKLDYFGLLSKTASSNTIGNVTVHEITS